MSAASYGKAMIESRKRADNAYKEMDTVIANDKKILQIANFENTTAKTIDRLSKVVSLLPAYNSASMYTVSFSFHFLKLSRKMQSARSNSMNTP